jgi:hypothetical protein
MIVIRCLGKMSGYYYWELRKDDVQMWFGSATNCWRKFLGREPVDVKEAYAYSAEERV